MHLALGQVVLLQEAGRPERGELSQDLRLELFLDEVHGLAEGGVEGLVGEGLEPGGHLPGDPVPERVVDPDSALDPVVTIVVGVDREDELFVDILVDGPEVLGQFEPGLPLLKNLLAQVAGHLREVVPDQPGRGQPNSVQQRFRELLLVVVQVLGRLVLAPHVDDDVALVEQLVVPGPADVRALELRGVAGE